MLLAAGTCAAATPTSGPAGLGEPFAGGASGNLTGPLLQMLATAMVIVVLGAVAIYTVKRLLPKLRPAGKRIRVLETTYIGPRKAVHLLQVGARKLLVASSPTGVVKLDDVTEAYCDSYAEVARRTDGQTQPPQKAPDAQSG